MGNELLITTEPTQTQIAYLEQGQLQELHIEQADKQGIVGNLYKGRVRRVLPGMQSAFVDIGLDKAAFLHAADIALLPSAWPTDASEIPDIGQLVYSGQELVVQVVKEPLGNKGARLTTALSLAGRYLVFLPKSPQIAVSQRIEHQAERQRLQQIMTEVAAADQGGFIVRTAAEGIDQAELQREAHFLQQLWQTIQAKSRTAISKCLLYSELALPQRLLRDFVASDFSAIWVDGAALFQQLYDFCGEYRPELQAKVRHYTDLQPLWDRYQLKSTIDQALLRRVDLPSGGYLVIDQTEALTSIDVNSGAFVGKRNLEETVLALNIEASQVIAQQLRLRNLGGIIIIDFIDMQLAKHRQQLLNALKQALSRDRVKTLIHHFSSLGLVEMTRKRTRESLAELLCQPCPQCAGSGRVKTLITICHDILFAVRRLLADKRCTACQLHVSPAVAQMLEQQSMPSLLEMAQIIGQPIGIQVQPLYTHERFDVIMT